MSIINTFDPISEEILKPTHMVKPIENFPETVIVTFPERIRELVTTLFPAEEIGYFRAGVKLPIHAVDYRDKRIGIYMTLVGGSASAGLLEEAIAAGAKKILFFGSCGALDKSLCAGHIIVPTEAYRDEGTSYHYLPAGDWVEVKTAEKTAEILTALNIPFAAGKTWTTDAIYRETKDNTEKRKRDGCITVEMECASVMAVAQFRGVECYQFLYAADCLDDDDWDPRILGQMPEGAHEKYLRLALEVARRL